MQVSSPAGYHVPAQQSFGPPAQYPIQQMQSATTSNQDYATQQGHMQPPPVPQTAYQPAPETQQYAPQHIHPPMQFRDDAATGNYSLTHYPSG